VSSDPSSLGSPLFFFSHIFIDLGLAIVFHALHLFLIHLVLNTLVALNIVVHIQHIRERYTVIYLYSLESLPIKGETGEMNEQDWG
jgi:hypothetical protein